MKKRMAIFGPLVLVAAAVFWVTTRGAQANARVQASGTIEATDADLGFQLPGRVLEITVREGGHVERGDVLARLDARELEAGTEAARAQVAAAEARLAELRSGSRPEEVSAAEAGMRAAVRRAEEAASDAERARTLFNGGAISRQALDRAETALEAATSTREQAAQGLALTREGPRAETVQAQRAMVAQAQANFERSVATLANAVITAPFAGIVTLRHREPGETVSPGAPVVTLLDPEDRWVRIYVREDEIGLVRLGAAAEIVADTDPDRVYAGEVVFIGSEAEFTPRNVQTAEERIKLVYPVKVRITGDPGFALKPGVPADVTLVQAGS